MIQVGSTLGGHSAPADITRKARRSAGGQALHHWDRQGKLTTIHVVYELASAINFDVLVEAVNAKILTQFPRLRGYVSDDGTNHSS